MYSLTEENYLKAIFKLSHGDDGVSTNAIAEEMQTKAASVTDMLKKLAEKKLIKYEKYYGVTLLAKGKKIAVGIVRKHRLWEVFLFEKLKFSWDQVHEVAEQLEHVKSELLIDKLDDFLGNPKFDPHGDPIPDRNGVFEKNNFEPLSSSKVGNTYLVTGVTEHNPEFLRMLDTMKIGLGTQVYIKEKQAYDGTIKVELRETGKSLVLSHKIISNIFVKNK